MTLPFARKYRPRKLQDYIGQEQVKKSIINAIESDHIHHAFLFSGTRGVGKTTIARLLALCLNCKSFDKPTVNPCLECNICKDIIEQTCLDVIEIDAASNTGVDSIREIIENVSYQPVYARYKIYIIDEVHMLSKSAFNALLKTLEEPPCYAKFILATTEIKKIPVTILSRCNKFKLNDVNKDVIIENLKKICNIESIKYEEKALETIAVLAQGSIRDSLSILEQGVILSNDRFLTFDNIKEITGNTDLFELLYYLYKSNYEKSIELAYSYLKDGMDGNSVSTVLLEKINKTILKINKIECYLSSDDEQFILKLEEEKILSVPRLNRIWQIIINSMNETKLIDSKMYLEMLITKICYSNSMPLPNEILKMIQQEDK